MLDCTSPSSQPYNNDPQTALREPSYPAVNGNKGSATGITVVEGTLATSNLLLHNGTIIEFGEGADESEAGDDLPALPDNGGMNRMYAGTHCETESPLLTRNPPDGAFVEFDQGTDDATATDDLPAFPDNGGMNRISAGNHRDE